MNFALRLLLVLGAMLPVGCKVVASADVDSPPRVDLKYRVDGATDWVSVDEPTEISIHKKATLYLYACATHPGGVEVLMIKGSGQQRCNTSGGPVATPYHYYAETRASASVGELTPETLLVLETIDMRDLCDLGGPAGSRLVYHASARLFQPTVIGSAPKLTVKLLK